MTQRNDTSLNSAATFTPGGLFRLKTLAVLIIALFAIAQARAQTLQFSFPFSDTGTTTTSSGGAAGAITLNTVYTNNAANWLPVGSYAPIDLHGGAGSGTAAGQALDFSKVTLAQDIQPAAASALAFTTNNANLGLGSVSQFTVSFWFNFTANNLNNAARLLIFGTNGIADGGAGAISIQVQSASQLQFAVNGSAGVNASFSPLINGEMPVAQWEFVTLTYDTSISNGVISLYTGDATHAPVQVVTNVVANEGPLNFGTAGTLMLGNRLNFQRALSGKLANVQFYTGAGNAAWVSNLWAQTAPSPAISVPTTIGADVGSSAILAVTVPSAFNATSNYVVTLTSDNSSVVASTTVTLPQYLSSQNFNLPLLAQGTAHVTASGPGLGANTTTVAGLNESGLINQWQADTYVSGQSWTDSVSQVVATINVNSRAAVVPGIFGSHAGVIESNYTYTAAENNTASGNGFLIPAGTAFGGATAGTVSNWTVAVVFEPLATGNKASAYYNCAAIMGWDISGSGKTDWGIGWGGADGSQAGSEVWGGIGFNGGDSAVGELSGNPNSGLNHPHSAVMQMDANHSIHSLYVDGQRVAVNYIANFWTINATNNIPILQSIYDGSLNGYVAEIRLYTNALVNPGALGSMLLSRYSSSELPATLGNLTPAYVDPVNNVTLQVQIPVYASASGAYILNVTSSVPTVVNLANSIVFPEGVTTSNLTVSVIGSGFTTITASGNNIISADEQIGGLYPRTLTESFQASSLTNSLASGGSVEEWDGSINGTPAYAGANAPILNGDATPIGTPSVQFTKASQTSLGIISANDPVAGMTNFSVVAVFRANDVGSITSGANDWWDMAGIADHELNGTTYDWGLELDGSAKIAWGTGEPDTNLTDNSYSILDPLFHVVVSTYDFMNGVKTVQIDDQPAFTVSNVASSFRLPGTTSMGVNHYNTAYLSGEIAELDFYNGALEASERTNIINSLKSTYDLLWPDQALIGLTANVKSFEIGTATTLTVSIPAGYNQSSPVTVAVSSDTPGVVTVNGSVNVNITFAAGATNVQTVSAQMVASGSAVISVSGSSPLVGSSITLGSLPVPTALEIFKASDLPNQIPGIANGNTVPTWLGEVASTPASADTVAPVFHANATASGSPSVVFTSADQTALDIPSANDPTAGATNFSVVAVFKLNAAPAIGGGLDWPGDAGIADHEISGYTYDWGLEIDNNSEFVWGVGVVPNDNTQPYTNYNAGSQFHVVVGTYDTVNGISTITVDDQPAITQTGLFSLPRLAEDIRMGENHYGTYLDGELAELDFYNGALSVTETTNAINILKSSYNITFPDQTIPTISLAITGGPGHTLQITWPTTSGYVLQSTTNLVSAWSNSALPVSINGGASTVTDSTTNATMFYRLYHP